MLNSTVLDNKLSFSPNTKVLCKWGQRRLYCLRKQLWSFNVDKTLMCMFYRSYFESLYSFSLLCWFNSLNVKNKNCLKRIVNQGSKITVRNQMTMAQLYHTVLFHCVVRLCLARLVMALFIFPLLYCFRVGGIKHMSFWSCRLYCRDITVNATQTNTQQKRFHSASTHQALAGSTPHLSTRGTSVLPQQTWFGCLKKRCVRSNKSWCLVTQVQ